MFLALSSALAAPVVWTAPPTEPQRAWLASVGGDDEVTLGELQARLVAPEDPGGRLDALAKALEEVRAYETRLDGERIIMDDLQAALGRIEVLRDEEDRSRVFAALAYQGFAVHRFFGGALEGEDAAPWRDEIQGSPIPLPWRDAIALDPDRTVTSYDIAEAPQRVAFGQSQEVVKAALPGGLHIQGASGQVFVDGRAVDASTNLRVPPGLHYVHQVLGGQIVAHAKKVLEPGGTANVDLAPPEQAEVTLVGLTTGSPIPEGLADLIEAAGGTLWIATPRRKGADVVEVTAAGVAEAALMASPAQRASASASTKDGKGLYAVVSLGGGWVASGDFYQQAPEVAPRTVQTVNGGTFTGGVAAGLQLGVLRTEAGLDALFTPGAHHVALSGNSSYRLRPAPYVGVGLTWLMATGGFLWPYHPVVGAKAALPLPAGLEVRADFRFGIPLTLKRADGSEYSTLPLFTAGGQLAYRFGPGAKASTF